MQFPQLLIHSNFSFLNSTISIDEIINFFKKNNYKYAVITEFKYCFSFLNFFNKARKNNLIPVFSLQFIWKNSNLLLIAKNFQGFSNLLKISSYQEIKEEWLSEIIVIYLEGEMIFQDHVDFYIANEEIENGVFIRENKFSNKEDFEFYCLLQAIKNTRTLEEEKIFNLHIQDNFLYYPDKLNKDSFQIKNIFKILNSCENYEILTFKNHLNFSEILDKNPDNKLKKLVNEALKNKKFSDLNEKNKYENRANFELEIITKKNFSLYFLIVYDAVNWAKNNDIFIGPGRGSVCGSLVSYLLNITEIDPIKYDLYFERFLNPDRDDNPDIDIDVAANKRELLLEYLSKKYGKNHCSLISTFQTFKYKNSLQFIAKALEISELEIKKISNLMEKDSLSDYFENPILLNFFSKYPKILVFLEKIKNFPKINSIHPAGVILFSYNLLDYFPLLMKDNDISVVQWSSDDLKFFNVIKFDFLSLNYLTFLYKISQKVEKKEKKKIYLERINEFDLKVYETIIRGRNSAIFQFENEKILDLISSFKPKSVEDLALISAIHRPGASNQIPILLERRHSSKKWISNISILNKILNKTFGILVYQEQLMKIFSEITKLSFGKADSFRRTLLSSAKDVHDKLKEDFINFGVLNNYSKKDLFFIWDTLFEFSKYSFNFSHAIAYAKISYFLLWFKTYYPEIFYVELLNLFSISDVYLSEIESIGYLIKGPDIKFSKLNSFSINENKIYFPIVKISSLSSNFFDKFPYLEEKNFTCAVKAIEYYAQKCILKSDLQILIKVGFFDSLMNNSESRFFLEENLSTIYESSVFLNEKQEKIFDLNLTNVKEDENISERYKQFEEKSLGINLRLPKIGKKFLKEKKLPPLSSIYSQVKNSQLYFAFISELKKSKTKYNKDFFWIKLSDGFFKTIWIPYFLSDYLDVIEKKRNFPIGVIISKKKNNLVITKMHIVKNHD